ncbi:MAG: beta-ketoacyl synthase chain length factor [Gammaproteobacteria bacterium]
MHNSPAGYWTIASQCQAPSLSLSANAGTCAAGLMEAMATALAENAPVLFIAYDHPAPAPLADVWPVVAPFALGLLLSPLPASKARCLISAILVAASGADHCLDPELERLRLGNPAARGLPLLAVAGGAAQQVTLPYSDTLALRVDVEPCG